VAESTLPLGQVDVTDSQGRTLSGVDVSSESLQEAADQHEDSQPDHDEPEGGDKSAEPSVSGADAGERGADPQPAVSRNADGTFQKQTRGQKRFDEMRRKIGDAERLANEERTRRESLERELHELRTRPTTPVAPSRPAEAPAPATVARTNAAADATEDKLAAAGRTPTRPRPDENDIGTKYQGYIDLVADTARWVTEQELPTMLEPMLEQMWAKKEQERQQMTRGRELATSWETATKRGRESYADFDRVIAPLVDFQLEGPLLDTLAAHPQAEHVAYRLMSDPTLRDAFVGRESNPYQRAMILGSLLSVGSSPAAPASGSAPVSSTAPPPYQPVGSRAKTTSPSAEDFVGGTGDVSDQYEKFRQFSSRRR
jgi:hypothetical protein